MVLDDGDLRRTRWPGPDEGCELASSCLDCPFERCLQEEDAGGDRRREMEQRDAQVSAAFREGKGTYLIAQELGVSRRTVQRSLKRARQKRVNHA